MHAIRRVPGSHEWKTEPAIYKVAKLAAAARHVTVFSRQHISINREKVLAYKHRGNKYDFFLLLLLWDSCELRSHKRKCVEVISESPIDSRMQLSA